MFLAVVLRPPNIKIVSHGWPNKVDLKINEDVNDLLGSCWHNLNKDDVSVEPNDLRVSYNWNSENGNFFLRHFTETEERDSRELNITAGILLV